MQHPIHRVCSFRFVRDFVLGVTFEDGSEQVIDFQPIFGGKLFGPLRDLNLFNQVQLDPEVHTLVWPNGADFDPATLYEWPENVAALAARAKQWNLQAQQFPLTRT